MNRPTQARTQRFPALLVPSLALLALVTLSTPGDGVAQNQIRPPSPTFSTEPSCGSATVGWDLSGLWGVYGVELRMSREWDGETVEHLLRRSSAVGEATLDFGGTLGGALLVGATFRVEVRGFLGNFPITGWSESLEFTEPAVQADVYSVEADPASPGGQVLRWDLDRVPEVGSCAGSLQALFSADGASPRTRDLERAGSEPVGGERTTVEMQAYRGQEVVSGQEVGLPGPPLTIDPVPDEPADPPTAVVVGETTVEETTAPEEEPADVQAEEESAQDPPADIAQSPPGAQTLPPPPTLETFPYSCGRGAIRWDLSGVPEVAGVLVRIVRLQGVDASTKSYSLPVQGELPFDPFEQGHGALKGAEYRITVQGLHPNLSPATPESEPAVFVEPVAAAAIPDVQPDPDDPLGYILRWDISRMPEIRQCGGEIVVLEVARDSSFDQVEGMPLSESSGSLTLDLDDVDDDVDRGYLRLRVYNRTVAPENQVGLPSESVLLERADAEFAEGETLVQQPQVTTVPFHVQGLCDPTGVTGVGIEARKGSEVVRETTDGNGDATLTLTPGEWNVSGDPSSSCRSDRRTVVVGQDGRVENLEAGAFTLTMECRPEAYAVSWESEPRVESAGRVVMRARIENLGEGGWTRAPGVRFTRNVSGQATAEVARFQAEKGLCPGESATFTASDAVTDPTREITYAAGYLGEDIYEDRDRVTATIPPSAIRIVSFTPGQTRSSLQLPNAFASLDFTARGRTPTRYRAGACGPLSGSSWTDLPTSGVPTMTFDQPGANELCLQLSDGEVESDVVARTIVIVQQPEEIPDLRIRFGPLAEPSSWSEYAFTVRIRNQGPDDASASDMTVRVEHDDGTDGTRWELLEERTMPVPPETGNLEEIPIVHANPPLGSTVNYRATVESSDTVTDDNTVQRAVTFAENVGADMAVAFEDLPQPTAPDGYPLVARIRNLHPVAYSSPTEWKLLRKEAVSYNVVASGTLPSLPPGGSGLIEGTDPASHDGESVTYQARLYLSDANRDNNVDERSVTFPSEWRVAVNVQALDRAAAACVAPPPSIAGVDLEVFRGDDVVATGKTGADGATFDLLPGVYRVVANAAHCEETTSELRVSGGSPINIPLEGCVSEAADLEVSIPDVTSIPPGGPLPLTAVVRNVGQGVSGPAGLRFEKILGRTTVSLGTRRVEPICAGRDRTITIEDADVKRGETYTYQTRIFTKDADSGNNTARREIAMPGPIQVDADPARLAHVTYRFGKSQIGEIVEYAQSRGFRFETQVTTGATRCLFGTDPGILLSNTFGNFTPIELRCVGTLFGGRRLAEGWQLVGFEFRSDTNSAFGSYDIVKMPTPGTGDAEIRVVYKVTPLQMTGHGYLFFDEIRLSGPSATDWREAFR